MRGLDWCCQIPQPQQSSSRSSSFSTCSPSTGAPACDTAHHTHGFLEAWAARLPAGNSPQCLMTRHRKSGCSLDLSVCSGFELTFWFCLLEAITLGTSYQRKASFQSPVWRTCFCGHWWLYKSEEMTCWAVTGPSPWAAWRKKRWIWLLDVSQAELRNSHQGSRVKARSWKAVVNQMKRWLYPNTTVPRGLLSPWSTSSWILNWCRKSIRSPAPAKPPSFYSLPRPPALHPHQVTLVTWPWLRTPSWPTQSRSIQSRIEELC